MPVSAFFQVLPPSCVRYTPLPGPPLNIAHVCSSTCHMPAISTSGWFGSIEMPEHPVFGSTKSDLSHVAPPSLVLYTPRSCCGAVTRPMTHAYTMFGFVGCTMMRPMRPASGRPMFFHVLPASVDL